MSQAFVTVIVPFPAERTGRVNQDLDALGDPAGAPYGMLRAELNKEGHAFVHFMSIVVVDAEKKGRPAHLVIEVSGDGTARKVVRRLAEAIPNQLRGILDATLKGPAEDAPLGRFLERHRRSFRPAIGRHSGLYFSGTTDLPVERIRWEAALACHIRAILDTMAPGSAYSKLQAIRKALFEDPARKWAFVAEPIAGVSGPPKGFEPFAYVAALLRDFAWPLPFVALALAAACRMLGAGWPGASMFGIAGALILAAAFAMWIYVLLRRDEKRDVPFDREPDPRVMQQIVEREDRTGCVQNHLVGVSVMKPGVARYFTLLAALWVIRQGGRDSRPGFLDKIGSIHFARWVRLPGTRQLVFLSNYDGSWESYLEDFIARLRQGLTSVWSNTLNFPKTTNLYLGGAEDGSRFKRWARRQQIPTRLWFSAYPELTAHRIRLNALIRHGFASAADEEEAAKWLAHFGYAGRDSLEMREIPTLAFGGLSKLLYSRCMLITLPHGNHDDSERSRAWLRSISERLSYGDRMPKERALVVGLTGRGMVKLGLDGASLASFPDAFRQGMDHPQRMRALGDTGAWAWDPRAVDAVLLVYVNDKERLQGEVDHECRNLVRLGCAVNRHILLEPLQPREPFGFIDGISQPIMRGTVRGSRDADRLNTVNPGEMVLGYRDNLGIVAPSPRMCGRDIGRNGTFLVVRQLEQDTHGFDQYLQNEAARFIAAHDPRVPTHDVAQLAEWIGAKMLGRWRDGSSLVRNPNLSAFAKKRPLADNAFLYGREDPDGLRCPFGAHIRRANPRDSFDPGSEVQIDISNRHRLLRVGRNYESAPGANPGLLFMCVNADIERQFEFLQQSWILGANFHGLENEVDPIIGCTQREMIVPTPNGPLRLRNLGEFVTVLGGGYFFMPGRSALAELCTKRSTAGARRQAASMQAAVA